MIRAWTTHKELWQQALRRVCHSDTEPPAPPAQKRREQNEVGIAIAEAAFVYQIERDNKYLLAGEEAYGRGRQL